MNHTQQAIAFREAMEQPISASDPTIWQMQQRLIVEESHEFIAESRLSIHMQANTQRAFSNAEWQRQHAATLKELADLAFVCFQYAAAMGWDLDEALNRVWTSNMSKLGDDGQPVRRDDGKVLKGPNYRPPDLTDLVQQGPYNQP